MTLSPTIFVSRLINLSTFLFLIGSRAKEVFFLFNLDIQEEFVN